MYAPRQHASAQCARLQHARVPIDSPCLKLYLEHEELPVVPDALEIG